MSQDEGGEAPCFAHLFSEDNGRDASRAETLVPIFRVGDVDAAAAWYGRLDFVLEGVHRFAEGLPRYAYLRRGDVWLHLSEHRGDAPPASVAYLYVDDVDTIAVAFGATVEDQPWRRDIELVDPDGNRLRVGTRAS